MPDGPAKTLAPGAPGAASLSPCGAYRYLLTRTFACGAGSCLFIMLNPSTADAEHDDPTIRRCSAFARRWNVAELRVVNLFALRAADPGMLELAPDPVGPRNDAVIAGELNRSGLIVLAWGNRGRLWGRADAVRKLVRRSGSAVHHFETNCSGEPRHPLYLPSDATLSLYDPA